MIAPRPPRPVRVLFREDEEVRHRPAGGDDRVELTPDPLLVSDERAHDDAERFLDRTRLKAGGPHCGRNTLVVSLIDHTAAAGLEDFVTGLIGRVDLRTGSVDLVNAGHVAPYLVRESRSVPLTLPVHLPLGLFADTAYRTSRVDLQPGDRLVFLTDGMIERNAVGVDFAAAIAETRSLHPREAVRALADRVLKETANQLKDDATVLRLDWHGGHGGNRNSHHGAEHKRASEALS